MGLVDDFLTRLIKGRPSKDTNVRSVGPLNQETRWKVTWDLPMYSSGWRSYGTIHDTVDEKFDTEKEAREFIIRGRGFGLNFRLFKLTKVLTDKEVEEKI